MIDKDPTIIAIEVMQFNLLFWLPSKTFPVNYYHLSLRHLPLLSAYARKKKWSK